MFNLNLSKLSSSLDDVQDTTASLLSQANNSFPYLFHELTRALQDTRNELNKIATPEPRLRRGLINGLGTAIKFVSGNLDQDDFDNLENQIHSLRVSRTDEIEHINKLISFSNSISKNFMIQ